MVVSQREGESPLHLLDARNDMAREEIALQLFAAFIARESSKIDIYPNLGEKQIRVAFALADTFLLVAAEDPEMVAGR